MAWPHSTCSARRRPGRFVAFLFSTAPSGLDCCCCTPTWSSCTSNFATACCTVTRGRMRRSRQCETASIAKQQRQEPARNRAVRRAQYRERRPPRLPQDSLLVRERLEAVESVIAADAAGAEAAERQRGLSDVKDAVVHRHAA